MSIKMYKPASNSFENESPKSNPGQQGLHTVAVNSMLIRRAASIQNEQVQMGAAMDTADDIIDDITNAYPIDSDPLNDGTAS